MNKLFWTGYSGWSHSYASCNSKICSRPGTHTFFVYRCHGTEPKEGMWLESSDVYLYLFSFCCVIHCQQLRIENFIPCVRYTRQAPVTTILRSIFRSPRLSIPWRMSIFPELSQICNIQKLNLTMFMSHFLYYFIDISVLNRVRFHLLHISLWICICVTQTT